MPAQKARTEVRCGTNESTGFQSTGVEIQSLPGDSMGDVNEQRKHSGSTKTEKLYSKNRDIKNQEK